MGIRGCAGCMLCQKRLRLSWKVDECKPLPRGRRRTDAPSPGRTPITRGVHSLTSELNLSTFRTYRSR